MDNFSDFFWPMEIGLSEETPNNIISYHLAEDGIYCRKNVFADKYIVYKDDKVSDLPKIKENLHPIEDSKIPARLLRESLSFFKYINVHFNQWLEAYVIFGMDKSGKYFLYVPSQDVQHAHVHASIEEFYDAYPGCYIVCDIHSHCDFGAFWSGQDSADDIKGRYSVVAGHNAKVFPDIKCRFNYSGKYIDLEVDSLFEENDNYLSQDYDYKEWINKLNEHSEVVIVNKSKAFEYGTENDEWPYHSKHTDQYEFYGKYFHNNKSEKNIIRGASMEAVVSRCTHCGKFTNIKKMATIEDETLCERCVIELGLEFACSYYGAH